jgi:hypothetical protein
MNVLHPCLKLRAFLTVTKALLCICLLAVGTNKAFAQADQGAITGVIQDPTGAVIPNAQVTLTNKDNGFVLKADTDSSGNYVFSPVKIGNYSVEATAPGFAPARQENIQLHVQDRVSANLELKAGSQNTEVTVSTSPALLQTEEGSTGQVIESKTINDTPLNGRNWVFIAQLTAGVAPSNGARGQKGGDFNANGQRAEQNNYIMDGVDNNVNVVDFFNGASYVVRPPPDALAEFKVQTGAYSSEFGHSAGAVVNASIKSGTNNIHGSLWEYIRNDAFDVREYFQATPVIPKYRQNQFGATLGLPLIKNKLFFFGDVEANRIVFGQTNGGNSGNFSVPTIKERTGDFSELLSSDTSLNNNVVRLYVPNATANGTTLVANNRLDQQPGVTLDPVALRLLSLFPLPNVGAVGKTFNNYTSRENVVDNTFQWDVRADWNISAKDQTFGRYSYNHEPSTHPAPLGTVLDGGGFGNTGQLVSLGENFAGSETHIFTPTLTNEFRFGYNYGHYAGLHNNANSATLASGLGLGGVPFAQNNGGLPFFSVQGLSNFGSPQFYATNEYENVYQVLDNVTKVLGNHTLKGGVSIQRIRFSTSQPTQPRGTYTYTGTYTGRAGVANTGSGIADLLTNNMNSAAISNVFTSDDVRFNRAGYVQDDWKASKRLTLNYGVRYDYSTPYLERHDNQAAFVPTSAFTSGGAATGQYLIPRSKQNVVIPAKFLALLAEDHITLTYTDNRYLVNPQKSNVAPRVGFSFKATEKAVVHGGYGIFFGGLESTGYYPNFGENFPFEFDSTYAATSSCVASSACPTNGFTLESGLPQKITSPSQPTLRGGEANVRTPYSQQYNLTVEYGLSNSMVASVGYVGAVARHLQFFPNPNGQTALTPSGFSGYTDVNGDKTNPFQPFPHFSGFSYTAYDASSNYNSLQTKLEKRLTHGLSFLTTYTWAHSLDNADTPLGSSNDQGTRSVNILGLRADYGPSGFDVRHRFTLNGNYELPFGKGRTYLNKGGVTDYLIGRWASSFVFRAETGQPLTIGTNGIANPGGAAYNAIRIGDPFAAGGSANSTNPGISCPTTVRTVKNWYNPCAFANPQADNIGYSTTAKYSDGSAVPNSIAGQAAFAYVGSNRGQTHGPGYERVDASLFKSFPIFREQYLQFRADIFNVLNTPAYGAPSTTNISTNGGNITGSRVFQANTPDSRFFQFALKYQY